MKTEPNDPAHPTIEQNGIYTSLWNTVAGLTKREMMATAVIQGMVANGESHSHWADQAERAVKIADYLIEALNKGK